MSFVQLSNGTFSPALVARLQRLVNKTPQQANLEAELILKGPLTAVAATIRHVASELNAALQYAMTCPPGSGAISLFNMLAKAVPPAPLSVAGLTSIDSGMGQRLDDMCRVRPNDAALKQDLASPNKITVACALCYLFAKEFNCTIKGGAIRDIVVLRSPPNDLDMALPKRMPNSSNDITDSNWKSELGVIEMRLKALGGKIAKSITGRPWGGHADSMLNGEVTMPNGWTVELEFVPPYNADIWPQRSVDATMNNLQVRPADLAASQISQIVAIGVSIERIVRQIAAKKTSPVYDIRWTTNVPPGKKPEGVHGNAYCEGTSYIMRVRLDTKMRGKGWALIEGPAFAGDKVVLYHGTDAAAQKAILSSPAPYFRPGKSGNLGAGIYLSRDLTICKMFGSHFLKLEVMPGAVKAMTGWDSSGGWADNGRFQTAFLEQSKSPRTPPLEEWCITNDALAGKLAEITSIVSYP